MRSLAGVLGIVCSLLIGGTLVVALPSEENANAYTPHSPIYILGDEDFKPVNGVIGGNGSAVDPYVIEGWEIDAGQSTGITVRETTAHFVIRIVHVHSSGLMYYGISLKIVVNGRIEDCNITDNWKGMSIIESSNVGIVGNFISKNEEGVYVRDSSNLTIESNEFFNNAPLNGVVLTSVSNVTFRANRVLYGKRVGLNLISSSNVTISGNHIDGNGREGIRVSLSTNVAITGNEISHNSDGIELSLSSHVNISRSYFLYNNLHGIHLDSSTQVSFNRIYSAANDMYGVHVWNSSYVNISRSTYTLNSYGIFLYSSTGITVNECTAWNNANGAYLGESKNVSIVGSVFVDNWIHGINTKSSTELEFTRNKMHSNNVDGIRFVDVTNATATNNILSENLRGVSLENSESVVMHHNNFSNQANHARDNKGSQNMWDDGYPSGGNYWSGYTGTDSFIGPSQNESGTDGIGDIPYVIDADSQDNYPLMSPPGSVPSAPENLKAVWGDSFVNITWFPPKSDGGFPVTRYRIYRSTIPGGESYLTDRSWLTYFNDTSVTNGAYYYYRVSALNSKGEGPQSNEVVSIPTSRPAPPTDLQAALSGANWENVTINWSLSTDDGIGQGSVASYGVFRGLNYSSSGDGYQLIAELSNGTSEYADSRVGEGDPKNYFYLVCSVDVNNKTDCSEGQVGKITRLLSKGPNMISIPLLQSQDGLADMLKTMMYDKVWFYDPIDQNWISLIESKPRNSNSVGIDLTSGFWVNVTAESNLTIVGAVPGTAVIDLSPGWNLIGPPAFGKTHSVGDLRNATGALSVEGFDGSFPPYYLKLLEGPDILQAGHGYWVHVSQEVSWTISNS